MSEIDDLVGTKPERLWYVLHYTPEQPTWIEWARGGDREHLPGVPDPARIELRAVIERDQPAGGVQLYRLVPIEHA